MKSPLAPHVATTRLGLAARAGLAVFLLAVGCSLAPAHSNAAPSRSTKAASPVSAARPTAPSVVNPPSAANHHFGQPIFSADARGDIVTVGNLATRCDSGRQQWETPAQGVGHAAACLLSYVGAATIHGPGPNFNTIPPPRNNDFYMEPVDFDADVSTFSSSSARLAIPSGSTVLFAGLHWNAAYEIPGVSQVSPAMFQQRNEMKLKAPGSTNYTTIPADDTWLLQLGGTNSYAGYADVTSIVANGGAGNYWGADVVACNGFGGCFGSWTMTVVFANSNEPARNLQVWHGWEQTVPGSTQTHTVTGLAPPPSGPVTARIGVVNADGDRGYPDAFEISSPSHPSWVPFGTADRPFSPADAPDWFNSTTNAYGQRRTNNDATPNVVLNMNQDLALVEDDTTIDNTDTSFTFRTRSMPGSGEGLFNQVVHSAVLIYNPEIDLAKSLSPPGPVDQGDEVTWTLDVSNAYIDDVREAVVTDPIPPGLTFVPGSIEYSTGGPSSILGTKTDAAGDDEAEYDSQSRTLTFRVGAGATASAGGVMGVSPAQDDSDSVSITFRTTVDVPAEQTVTNRASAYGEGRALDDPYGPLVTQDIADADIAAAARFDLGITKTDGGAVIRKVGDRFTYTLVARNAGPSVAHGVVVRDNLDPRLRFVSSPGCTAAGQVVTCPIGDLASGADRTLTVTVEARELPDAAEAIPNVATISGDAPDVDCETDPDALCNSDDEHTPGAESDLGVTKDDGNHVVREVGERFDYQFTATNRGPDDESAAVVTDELPEQLRFVSSTAGCEADGQTVTCALGQLRKGEKRQFSITVEVASLAGEGQIRNVGRITGDNPNPDCSSDRPDALCNDDPELTPVRRPASPPPSGWLPRTGSSVVKLVIAGAALVGGGYLFLSARRRSKTAQPGSGAQ